MLVSVFPLDDVEMDEAGQEDKNRLSHIIRTYQHHMPQHFLIILTSRRARQYE